MTTFDELMQKDFLEKSDVEELRKTREGRLAIMAYITRERIAHSLGKIIVELGCPLPAKEKQEKLVWIIWRDVMGSTPVWELMRECKSAQNLLEKYGMAAEIGAFLNTDDVAGSA